MTGSLVGGVGRFAGSAAGRAIPILGAVGQILDSGPAIGPGLSPERRPLQGDRLFDPTPLAEQAVAASPPFLREGFTAPSSPDAGAAPTAFTPIPGAAAAPLPGFTPAPAPLGVEGLTPTLPQGFGPLPGFAAASPQGVTIPGFTPAGQTPALPGFGAVEPEFGGAQVLQNQGIIRKQALADISAEARRKGVEILTDADPDVRRYLDARAERLGQSPETVQAVTLGDNILVRQAQKDNVRVLREELIHVDQQRRGASVGVDGAGSGIADEIEARQTIVDNAEKWGITSEEVRELVREIGEIQATGRY